MKKRYVHFSLSLSSLIIVLLLIWPTTFVSSTSYQPVADESSKPAGFVDTGDRLEIPPTPPKAEPLEPPPPLPLGYDPDGRYVEVGRKISTILKKPALTQAEWGVDIRVVHDDSPVFVYNSDKLFPPASNVKLFTTAAALDRLGPDFRFRTYVAYEGTVTADNRLTGNLVLFGQGDPDLSGSIQNLPNQFAHLDTMAQKVRESGILEVNGDVIGDDSYFTFAPYGDGWTASDLAREYGAAVSALSFNNNLITLSLLPNRRVGHPARVFVYPSNSLLTVVNNTKTVSKGRTSVRWNRKPGSDRVTLSGQIARRSRGTSHNFLVKDPALYTARLFRERLIKNGVKVKGIARARHAGDDPNRSPANPIYMHESPPLLEIISHTNKKSQNLHAEILLRTLGAQFRGNGSDRAGLEVVYDFLREAGVTPSTARLFDGSGLSRYNLITPRAETMLLSHVAFKPYFSDFLDTLAISGLDGTLRHRMLHTPAFLRVFGKTGSLQNVTTLGGYVRTNSGKMLSFSILVNNHSFSSAAARKAIDQICDVIVEI
ncbi:MAG TPA: D-alanyl-D-alanine carboxypeptidase/D-alanyl-D-alanine-endopeptidase [Acidobacteriota bacterium]|nr:D-alanyl-D-alanine carboxypeptidase/D-alanyl-D-alanine-endopeptidase [Acidobacteriota bacterium]